jgi:mycothiol synthase
MRLRPATPADAQTATDLVIALDLAEVGEIDYSRGDLEGEWGELDLPRDTAIVEDDAGTPIGCAHFRGTDVLVSVDPSRRGEGAGTALLEWAETRGRERGAKTLRQGVGDRGAASRAFLEAHGWAPMRSFWRMDRDTVQGETADETDLRAVEPADAPQLHAITALAFARDDSYQQKTEEAWTRTEFNAHAVDQSLSRVALRDGVPVGYVLARRWEGDVIYVPLLAVHPDAQGQGLGGRMLKAVFAASGRAGQRQVRLNVASDNPNAVKLYERVGMREAWRVDDYEKALPN